MNILEFTFEPPTKWYGGGICVGQSAISISNQNNVTYIGPLFDESEYPQIRFKKKIILKDNNSVFVKAYNMFKGVTTRYYQEWKRAIKSIDPNQYDAVFLDFSYNDFIVEWAKQNGLKTAVRVHNIEADMIDSSLQGKVRDKYWVRNAVNGHIIKRREENLMHKCDHLIFLTAEDQRRASELYGDFVMRKSSVVPICMYSNNKSHKNVDVQKPYILARGSLYYGPNAEGIKWMIEHVWNPIQDKRLLPEYSLVVAGRNPDSEMKEIISNANNCTLIESPENIYPYFQNADLYLAPIFYGAGMKVKVAEAMSYGLTVIGTKHALIGYEEAGEYCIEVNNDIQFIEAIIQYIQSGKIDRKGCVTHFDECYSMQRSIESYNQIAQSLIKKE